MCGTTWPYVSLCCYNKIDFSGDYLGFLKLLALVFQDANLGFFASKVQCVLKFVQDSLVGSLDASLSQDPGLESRLGYFFTQVGKLQFIWFLSLSDFDFMFSFIKIQSLSQGGVYTACVPRPASLWYIKCISTHNFWTDVWIVIILLLLLEGLVLMVVSINFPCTRKWYVCLLVRLVVFFYSLDSKFCKIWTITAKGFSVCYQWTQLYFPF